MRISCLTLVLLGCVACDKQVHGTGTIYLYNATNSRVTVGFEGRSTFEELLRTNMGKLVDECIAGEYQVSIAKGDEFPAMVATKILKDRLTIINVDGAGCFARADVSGMYSDNKAPVRLLQAYKGEIIISIPDEIAIPPGQGMPEKRPKNTFAFQRVTAVPCEVAEDDWMIEDYLQKHR
jgi:hypothetical protein